MDDNSLLHFLQPFEVDKAKGKNVDCDVTHRTIKPNRSYVVPADQQDKLLQLVAENITAQVPVHLTECPQEVGPIRVNINLKYALKHGQRQHKKAHIKEFVNLYSAAIREILDIDPTAELSAYISQRDNPCKRNGNVVDGFHVEYPDTWAPTDLQYAIRSKVLKKLDCVLNNPDIGLLPVKNQAFDVLDASIIEKQDWLILGASKPGALPYKMLCVYTQDKEGGEMTEQCYNPKTVDELVESLQVLSNQRTDIIPSSCRPEKLQYVNDVLERQTVRRHRAQNRSHKPKKVVVESDEEQRNLVNEANILLNMLSPWRAEDPRTLKEIGICLFNISSGLYDNFVTFAKKSPTFNEHEVEMLWESFEQSDVNIGSMHRWAMWDSGHQYNEALCDVLKPLLEASTSGSTHDIAQVVYKMYKYQYKYLTRNRWAEFMDHRWVMTDELSLKEKFGSDVFKMFNKAASRSTHVIDSMDANDADVTNQVSRAQIYMENARLLRDINFKDKIMRECQILFKDPLFEKLLDQNGFLIGFENGVYDLKKGVFRDGRPEDYISMSTGNDFPEFNPDEIDIRNETSTIPEIQDIFQFMKQVFPKSRVRRYVFKELASHIEAYNAEEYFHIWTGTGGNGKSKLIELFESAFGAYTCKMPVTMLTQGRGKSGNATPELIAAQYCRFGSLQEPEQNSRLNASIMKEISGNDKMFIRGLYEGGKMVKPHVSLVLMCNEKPKIEGITDDGTWRRLIVVEFISKFVAGEPKGPYEFKRDTNLQHNFQMWAPWFMVILTQYYKVYRNEGLKPHDVPEIADATLDYRKASDAYASFVADMIKEDEDAVLNLDDAYAHFKTWFTNEFSDKAPCRRDFKAYLERKLNQTYGSGKNGGWKGYCISFDNLDQEEDHSSEMM